MTLDIKDVIRSNEYDFLRTDKNVANRLMLLTFGGSYSYGTSTEDSDIDLRGISLSTPEKLLGMSDFTQLRESDKDTTIYEFNRYVQLAMECSPNILEMLGCKPEHYGILTEQGKMLIDNRKLFLTTKAKSKFCGYSREQLARLELALEDLRIASKNPDGRQVISDEEFEDIKKNQEKRAKYIVDTLMNEINSIEDRYGFERGTFSFRVSTKKTKNGTPEIEIVPNEKLFNRTFNIRELREFAGTLTNIVNSYDTMGKRNRYAFNVSSKRLDKHAMHCVRTLMTGLDVIKTGDIITYRGKDLDLLMAIRNGEYRQSEFEYSQKFYDLINKLENDIQRESLTSKLPDKPDIDKIEKFKMAVNMMALSM